MCVRVCEGWWVEKTLEGLAPKILNGKKCGAITGFGVSRTTCQSINWIILYRSRSRRP